MAVFNNRSPPADAKCISMCVWPRSPTTLGNFLSLGWQLTAVIFFPSPLSFFFYGWYGFRCIHPITSITAGNRSSPWAGSRKRKEYPFKNDERCIIKRERPRDIAMIMCWWSECVSRSITDGVCGWRYFMRGARRWNFCRSNALSITRKCLNPELWKTRRKNWWERESER